MAIEGPISELNLIDLFQILSFNQKSGILKIDSSKDEKADVYFENGNVVFVRMEGQTLPLLLIKAGKITREFYEEKILNKIQNDDVEIAKEIIKMNIMSENEFRKFLQLRIEDTIYKLFELREGYFKFEEGTFVLDNLFRFKIKTESLIMEGSRRIDEWSRLSAKIPNSSVVPKISDNPDKMDLLDLKPKEWEIFSMINGKNTIKDIAEKYGDEFEIAKLIYGMITLGIVVIEGNKKDDSENSLDVAKHYFDDGLFDKTISELKNYLKREPKNVEAYRMIIYSFFATNQFDKINEYSLLAKNEGVDDRFIKKYNSFAYFKRGDIKKSIDELISLYDYLQTPNEMSKVEKLIESLKECQKLFDDLLGGKVE
ncbi:MAG: DUF4388 domain-containing protein [bacterium]|uniref:PatA-like N-terminal domain-containing protein n=1 Tax=candidate division TA06 bacterium 34_109 TaxID=1635277 RepID=A0A101I3K0_UNCT6|nr:MAG: hypothetical protein XD76_1056 [candidate division TA06 bacterium 32_111]KUK87270.1 MAG: hypothetical protein XE03_0878 [candidate division TA06 bacterium 34_109]MDI6700472.1 DUF4388 domain-containing protein [bacterium]